MHAKSLKGDWAPTAILESVLYCEDLEAAGRFYEQIVGLSLLSFEDNRHRFYRLRDGMLLLFQPESTQRQTVRVGGQTIPNHGARGPGHLAFSIGDEEIDSVRQHLNRHGVPIESEIQWPGGGFSLYCRDPAGNSIEFATRSLWFPSS